MNQKPSSKRWLWCFSLAAAAILFYVFCTNFGFAQGVLQSVETVLGPFIGGFVLAFFMYVPSSRLETLLKRPKAKFFQVIARPVSLTVVYVLLLGLCALAVYLLVPALITGLTDLASGLTKELQNAREGLEQLVRPGGALDGLGLEHRLDSLYDELIPTITDMITTKNLMSALKGVGNAASYIIDVVVAVIVSLYMLGGREHIGKAVKNLLSLFLKSNTVIAVQGYGRRSARIFYGYFYGALLDSFAVGMVASIGLLIFRVPYAVLLGLALGLLNLIPYFGAIIGCISISLITLLTTNIYTALGVLVYLIVIQQIDSNIIQPRVVGDAVGLRPIYVLLSITVFGGLFGFWGIFLGPPLMAIVQMFVRDASVKRTLSLANEIDTDTHSEE